jgi:hypothetical protein
MYTYIDTLFAYYKKHKDFYIYEKIVTEMVHTLVKNEDMSIINDKLHINYYDTKKCKQKVVSHFKNSEHLIKCILRSSHVPFLTNENYKYEGRYIDGISPYIFTDDTKNLFIQLIHFTNPLQCMNVKTDQNIYARLLRGVIAVNDFFMDGTTTICSYVDHKSYMIRLQLLARKYFILYIMLLIELLITIKNNVPLDVTNTILYTKGVSLFKYFWSLLQNKLV